ncbi:DNA replication initiation control protein YabA [Ligilactobacillus equi]|nr:DNA replication initiation control protein YabA [Ligilactobacillus equi]KRL84964.1 initiation-control protein [Ligilactobacillus equi DSM 15833 = JCM 10991]MCQ2557237.1 DNA replication initiation control protein YabA [Ligilactobacillus sp.]
MEKREVYENFEELEEKTMAVTQALATMKEEFTEILERNAELEIENQHLRERLQDLEEKNQDVKEGLSKSRQNLEKLYKEGFHVCNEMYGSRRVNDEPCIFCQDVIYGERA